MAAADQTPSLRGLRIAMANADAAVSLLERVFDAPPGRDRAVDATRAPRLRLAGRWLAPGSEGHDTLALQCGDLAHHRLHLARLGIAPLDGSALGCTPCLRLESVDTGACAVDLREVVEAGGHAAADTAARSAGTRLTGIELAVRTPERVAAHWAQLFHAGVMRDAEGAPSVAFDGVAVRFVLSPDGRPRVSAVAVEVEDIGEPMRRAAAEGAALRRPPLRAAEFDALGLRVELSQRTPG